MASPVPHRVARRLLGVAAMFVSLAMVPVTHMALAADGLSANAQDDAQRSVVNVVNFGADPQGVKDSAQAVKSAIAEVKTLSDAGTPSRLVFPQGTYQLYPESAEVRELYVSNTVGADRRYKDKTIAILLEGVSDVIVDGQGSHFQLHGQQTTLAVIDSSSVQMQNFSTDWTTPRVVDITIVGKGTNEDGTQWQDLRIPDGYQLSTDGGKFTVSSENSPVTGTPYWTYDDLRSGRTSFIGQTYSVANGSNTRSSARNTAIPFRQASDVAITSPGHVRVTYAAGSTTPAELGTSYQIRTTTRDTPGFFIWQSKNTTLSNVDVGYQHGFGLVSQFK